jgi:tetratricopeptide (TPR) repeat protein
MLGRLLIGILGLLLLPGSALAAKACKLAQLAELPITMDGTTPLVAAKINGSDVRLLVDSGAFYSVLSPASAAELKLHLHQPPREVIFQGTNGSSTPASVASVKEFTLAGIPLKDIDFFVGGTDAAGGAAGILGQNILRIADVEYDLANGAIRLERPHDCSSSANLMYWGTDGQAYSVMDINWATPLEPHTTGVAYLNGVRIRVMFDTGARTSVLGLHAAERAGIKPDSPGVVPGGLAYGIGRGFVKTWVAPFESFKIGDEEIRNTRLRIGELHVQTADMLIGTDFFLSHRIYVASSQGRLYFTYNGGPVFNLKTAAADEPAQDSDDQALDAGGFARRGAAFAARHEYAKAIADLTKACELAPQEAGYFLQRAQAYAGNQQMDLAKADIEQTLKLKPDDITALMVRAQVRLAAHDRTGAITDLDAADHAAAPQASMRLELGKLYQRANELAGAIAQYSRWIDVHPDDARLPEAYGARCWARAMSGQELEQGLADCNKANHLSSNDAFILQSRGTIRLRMGEYDRALSDFDASLKINPKSAWALYGRGQAQLHKQKTNAAESDFAVATALNPHIADEFKRLGLAARPD